MLKKTLIVLFVLVFSVTLIAGCGNGGNSGDTGSTTTAASGEGAGAETGSATITFTASNSIVLEGFAAVAEAAKERIGITVEMDIISDSGAEDILKTRLASSDMGDMFVNNVGAQMQVLNPSQNMVDLSNETYAARLDDAFLSAGSMDGVLYAAPLGSSMGAGFMYNKKVYAELGLDVPQTWDEFLVNCEAVKEAGKTAIIGSYKDDWTSQLILLADYYNMSKLDPAFGEEFFQNKANYSTNAAALRGFEKLYESNPYMNEDFLASTCDHAFEWLATGEGVHWPMLTSMLVSIEALYPEYVNDIGIFPIPSDDAGISGITVWGSPSLHIYSQSPNIDVCKRFLDFYLSDEGIAIYGSAAKPTGPFHILGVELGDDTYECVKDMMPYFESGATELAMEFTIPLKGPALPQICIAVGSNINTALEGAQLYDQDVEKQAMQLGLEGW